MPNVFSTSANSAESPIQIPRQVVSAYTTNATMAATNGKKRFTETSNFRATPDTSKIILRGWGNDRIRNMLNCKTIVALLVISAALCCELSAEAPAPLPRVELRGDTVVTPGSSFAVSLYLTDSVRTIGGFDIMFEFDFGALVFDSAALGAHTAGQWEYFTSRSALLAPNDTGSTAAFIRLLAIADNQDAANKHPKPESLVGPGEIARIYLYASERKEYQGKTTALRFLWNKCSDNTISDLSGNQLLLAAKVRGADGTIVTDERYSGPGKSCLRTGYNAPLPVFEFVNHSILIR